MRLDTFPDNGTGAPEGTVMRLGDPAGRHYVGSFVRRGDEWVRDEYAALDEAAGEALRAFTRLVDYAAAADVDGLLDEIDLGEHATRSRDFGKGMAYALSELRRHAAQRHAQTVTVPAQRTPRAKYLRCTACGHPACVAGEPVCAECRAAAKATITKPYGQNAADHEPDSWGMCRICATPDGKNGWQPEFAGPCPGLQAIEATVGA